MLRTGGAAVLGAGGKTRRRAARTFASTALPTGPAGDDLLAEAGHLLALRGELEQHQVDPGVLVGPDPIGELLGRTDQPGAQAAVGDAVLLQGHLRLQLRAAQKSWYDA